MIINKCSLPVRFQGLLLEADPVGVSSEETFLDTKLKIPGVDVVLDCKRYLGTKVDGLPDPKEGTLYIVPNIIRELFPNRSDLISFRDGKIEYGTFVYGGIPYINKQEV